MLSPSLRIAKSFYAFCILAASSLFSSHLDLRHSLFTLGPPSLTLHLDLRHSLFTPGPPSLILKVLPPLHSLFCSPAPLVSWSPFHYYNIQKKYIQPMFLSFFLENIVKRDLMLVLCRWVEAST